MLNIIRKIAPFELKRTSSRLSVILAFIFAGVLAEVGRVIFYKIADFVIIIIPFAKNFSLWANSTSIQISYFTLFIYAIVFIILLFPIYRYLDKFLLTKFKREIIFEDDFSTDKGWYLNYWGTTNQNKTNRIENSTMVFEAKNEEVLNKNKEFGAYLDIRNGIYNGNTYEITCRVKADLNTTMGFQLWIHDTKGGNKDVSKKTPATFFTPNIRYQELRLKYKANTTNAIRIHLHNKAGKGRIIVNDIKIVKV